MNYEKPFTGEKNKNYMKIISINKCFEKVCYNLETTRLPRESTTSHICSFSFIVISSLSKYHSLLLLENEYIRPIKKLLVL